MNHAASASDLLKNMASPNLYFNDTRVQLSAPGTGKPTSAASVAITQTPTARRFQVFAPPNSEKPAHDIHFRNIRMVVSVTKDELVLLVNDKLAPVVHLKFTDPETMTSHCGDVDEIIAHLRHHTALTYSSSYPMPMFGSTSEIQTEQARVQALPHTDSEPESQMSFGVVPDSRIDAAMRTIYPKYQPGSVVNVPCGGFTKAYVDMCDFFGVAASEQVQWYIDSVYGQRQSSKIFSLHDFVDGDSGSVAMPLIYALQWNVFFESIHINDAGKFSSDLASCLVAVVQRNTNIKEFAVTGSSVASKEFFSTLADSISANANSKLTILDFSSVAVDEKSASSLASILYCLPNGLSSLRMVDCSLSKKSASSILAALKKTPLKTSESESSSSLNVVHASKFSMSLVDSLVHLDLSQNALPAEAVLALSEYLAMPNHLKKLSLSQCSIPNTEVLFGALVRGCLQELQQLELDGNKFTISESVNVAFDQFFRSVQNLHLLDLSRTRLSAPYLKALLKGLQENSGSPDVTLKLAANDFSIKEATIIGEFLPQLVNIVALDLSDNTFDGDEGLVVLFRGLKSHPKLASLQLDRVFGKSSLSGKGKTKTGKTPELKKLLSIPALRSLSLAENNMKTAIPDFLKSITASNLGAQEALEQNNLLFLDIRGNNIGDFGAFTVAQVLQSTASMREVVAEDNGFTLSGWSTISAAMEKNRTVRAFSISASETASLMKSHNKKASNMIKELNTHLSRNSNSSFGQQHRDGVISPMSPGGVSVFSGGVESVVNAGNTFSAQDADLSLAQQESLEKYNVALKRLAQILEDSNKSSIISDETRAANQAEIKFANGLVKNISASSTVLTQTGLIIEDSLAKQMEVLTEQSSYLTSSLMSIGTNHWSSVNENIAKLMASNLPLAVIGVEFSQIDEAHAQAKISTVSSQLKKVFQLAATFQINDDNFGTHLQDSIASEYKMRAVEGYTSLLGIVKNIAYDKMTTQLEKTLNQIRVRVDETEKEKRESGLVSPVNNRQSAFTERTSSRISQGTGVDVSSLPVTPTLVKSQPLSHLSKTGRPGNTTRRPPTRTIRSSAAAFVEDATVKEDSEAENEELRVPEPIMPAVRQRKPSLMESMLVADLKNKVLTPRKVYEEGTIAQGNTEESATSRKPSNTAAQPSIADLPPVTTERTSVVMPPDVPKRPHSNRSSFGSNAPVEIAATPPPLTHQKPKHSMENVAPETNLPDLPPAILPRPERFHMSEADPAETSFLTSHESALPVVSKISADVDTFITPVETTSRPASEVAEAVMKAASKKPILPPNAQSSAGQLPSVHQPRATSSNVAALRESVASNGSRDSLHVDKDTTTGAEKGIQAMKATLTEQATITSPRIVDDVRGSSSTDETKSHLKNQLSGMLMMPRPSDRPESVSSSVDDPPVVPSPTTKPASPIKPSALHDGIKGIGTKKKSKGLGSKLGELFKRKDKKHDDDSEESTPAESPAMEKVHMEPSVVTAPASVPDPVPEPAVVPRASPTKMGIKLPMGPGAGEGGLRKTVYDAAPVTVESSPATSPPVLSNASTELPVDESPVVNKKKFMTATPFAGMAMQNVQLRSRNASDAERPVSSTSDTLEETSGSTSEPQVPTRSALRKPVVPSPLSADASEVNKLKSLLPKPTLSSGSRDEVSGPRSMLKTSNSNINDSSSDWKKEAIAWATHRLGSDKGHSNIVELVQDGVSICELVQDANTENTFPKWKKNAVLPVHKLDNLNIAVAFTKVPNVTAEELLNGDQKKVNIYITALMKMYPASA